MFLWVAYCWVAQSMGLAISQDETPHIRVIPRTLEYLCIYFHEWAYMESQRQAETRRAFKRRVYDTLRIMSTVESKPWEVRIMQLQPVIDWSLVWGNLQNVRLTDGDRAAWYMVIHVILPTNVSLHRIRLTDTEKCTQCGRPDTILYRLKESGVRQEIREWTRTRISRIQRMDPRLITKEYLLRPCFKLWPRQRHQAKFWLLANVVFLCGEPTQDLFGTGLRWLNASDAMEDVSGWK